MRSSLFQFTSVTVNGEIEQDDSHYAQNDHSTYPGMIGDHGLGIWGEGEGEEGKGGEGEEGRGGEGEEERMEGGEKGSRREGKEETGREEGTVVA